MRGGGPAARGLRREHAAIVDAVADGRAEDARTCVADHIHGYFAQLRT